MSTIRVVNLQHTDATEPNIVLQSDGTSVFASGITISGGTNLTVSGTAEFASGTVSAPGITFIDDNNTGIYEPAADTVAITTAATERLRIDSSGRLLVGDSSIFANANADDLQIGKTTTANVGLTIGSSTQGQLAFGDAGDARAGLIHYQHTDNSMRFYTSGPTNERMRIDSSGRVLIGTTTEGYAAYADNLTISDSGDCGMTIRSGTSNQGNIYFSDGTSGSDEYEGIIQYLHNDDAMAFGVNNGTERLRIDSSGNVGIGTTSASGKVHIQVDDSGNSPNLLYLENLGQANGTGSAIFFRNRTGTAFTDCSIQGLGTGTNQSALLFSTETGGGAQERMRIDSSGNVGIGTSTPTGFELFHTTLRLSRTSGVTAHSDISITHASSANYGSLYFDNSASTGAFVFRTNGSSEKVRILGAGGITFNGDTAQANALDDYEEGTCTITMYVSGTSNVIGATNTTAYYTKVGAIVNVYYYSGILTISYSGNAEIDGLPFNSRNQLNYYPAAVFTHTNCFTTDIQNGYMNANTNNLYPIQRNSTNGAIWNTAGGAKYLMFNITYQTDQ